MADEPNESTGTEGEVPSENENESVESSEKQVVSIGKFQRIESERNDFKSQNEKLLAQIAALKGTEDVPEKEADVPGEDAIAKLKAGAEASRKTLEEKLAQTEKNYAVETALLKAGCKDTVAAQAHIDMAKVTVNEKGVEGVDVESLVKSYPYLFASERKSTGGAPAGATGGMSALEEKMWQAAGVTPPK